jgi:hypothetical protein
VKSTLLILSLVLAWGAAFAEQQEVLQSKPAPLDWNQAAESPRSRALKIATEGKSQGYALRDGFWSGTLEKGKPILIAVHLFAWNDYSFSAATVAPGSRIRLSVFDRWGNAAGREESTGETSASAGISAVRSDRFYIRLELTEGDKAETCVVYSYK